MRWHAASAAPVPAALIDAGFILALIDADETWHRQCVEAYNQTRLPLMTSEAVLTETFHLASRGAVDHRRIWQLVRAGAIQMSPISHAELFPIHALMAQYANRPMDFADATLVHLAGREGLSTILTIDHDDFETYRLPRNKKFTILPARRKS
jgi:predicted nucleic acid-binding protein